MSAVDDTTPNQPRECGSVLHLKDWPDAICHKSAGHPMPHDGETGSAVVTWSDRREVQR